MVDVISWASNPVVAGALTLVGRNVFGWLKNSMEDGEIQSYEWRRLAQTLIGLGGMAVFGYFGINAVFPDMVNPAEAAALASLVDVIKSWK